MDHQQTIQFSDSQSDQIDFNKLWIIIRKNLIWIILIFVFTNLAAYLFIRYTKNLYESESELKLEVKSEASELGSSSMMQDPNVNLMSGEIELVQSKLFLSRVLENGKFTVSFYSVGRVLHDEMFGGGPARISTYSSNHSLYDVPINFEELNSNEYRLSVENGPTVTARYGAKATLRDLELVIDRRPDYKRGDEVGYFFVINSRGALLDYLSQHLTAEPLNYNANTIRIAFKDHNPFKAQAILNKIDTLYLQYSNEQKNQANKQKIDWLVSELSLLEKKMESHENYFENFTLQNKTSDLNEDLKETIAALNAVDSQRFTYTQRFQDVSKLIDGLNTDQLTSTVSGRNTLPPGVSKLLERYQDLKTSQNQLKLSHRETAFAYRQMQQELESVRFSLNEELTALKQQLSGKIRQLDNKKSVLEDEFAALPDKSTEYSKNQRFYKLYEELYLTLMQSKSEFEIAQAGSIPDFKILSPATFPSSPISPKKMMVAGIGLVASIVFNFLFVGILYLLNNKITSIHEIEKVLVAPLLGTIPSSRTINGGLHILEHPKSMVSEAIRSLRTNLDFFQSPSQKKVIAISSTVSGEGKSFIAMNLGGVIALSKKKVVLIDLDMRKVKTSEPVAESDKTKGVSTILIKRNSWQECIQRTSLDCLDYIPSGPHPPNPSELLLNGEFTQLIAELKESYDFVILDTPPVGLVTDGIMAMKKADISIYVFRATYSKKEFLMHLRRILAINKIPNVTTVLNALPSDSRAYGYGYYEENSSPSRFKALFKR